MSFKFVEEKCEKCGLDLATAEPARVREVPKDDEGGMIFLGTCPRCQFNNVVEEVVTKGSKRKAATPVPDPVAEELGESQPPA